MDEQPDPSTRPGYLFGKLAVEHHMVTDEHLRECLQLQAHDPEKQLGQLLVERDYLTIGQLDYLIKTQREQLDELEEQAEISPEAALFGKLAVHNGLVSEEQLNAAVREKANLARVKIDLRLGEVLIKKGHLTAHQVQQLLEIQHKKILICTDCHCRFNIASFDATQTFSCKFCHKALEVPRDADGSVVVKETLRMPAPRLPPPPTDEDPEA